MFHLCETVEDQGADSPVGLGFYYFGRKQQMSCRNYAIVLSVTIALLLSGGGNAMASADVRETEDLPNIVVTASRTNVDSAAAVQAVEIISREAIEARNPISVADLLRQLVGVNVIQQGGRGGRTDVIIRGGEANFSVVLIDGVKVNDPTNTRGGSYDLSYLAIENIERIEIVRGPLSALYGSDALSGVINIVTAGPATGSAAKLEIGENGLRTASGRFGLRARQLGLGAQAQVYEDHGAQQGADYRDVQLGAKAEYQLNENLIARIYGRWVDGSSSQFPEDSGGPSYAVIEDTETRDVRESHLMIAFDASGYSETWLRFAASKYSRQEIQVSPGIAPGVFSGVPPNKSETEFVREQTEVSLGTDSLAPYSIVAGATYQKESGDSVGMIDLGFPLLTDFSLRRDTVGVFAEGRYDSEKISLQASVRWDSPDAIDAETTGQFGIIYKDVGERTNIRLNWGQGFKAPSFFALAHPLVGNPSLRSEKAESVDVGLDYYFRDSEEKVTVSLYRARYTDLIDFDPEAFTNVNRSRVSAAGAEITLFAKVSGNLSIQAHLTYSDIDIKDSEAILRGRPQWRAGGVVTWDISERVSLAASYLALDKFWDVSIPTGGLYLDGYNRLDLSASYNLNGKLSVGVSLDNLMETAYEEAVGFPATARRGRLFVRYEF